MRPLPDEADELRNGAAKCVFRARALNRHCQHRVWSAVSAEVRHDLVREQLQLLIDGGHTFDRLPGEGLDQ